MTRAPAVFISYSHDSDDHRDRVRALADRLRRDGVEAVLDQHVTSPPEGWPRWMDRHIREADFVLVICTELYSRRVLDKDPTHIGLGARWEGHLIYQHLYDAGAKNSRFIPAVFKRSDLQFIPPPLKGATHYLLSDQYEALYGYLTDQPRTELTKLGPIRLFIKSGQESATNVASAPFVGAPLRCASFAGREAELEWLDAHLDSKAGSGTEIALIPAAIHGLGGVGKTTLAAEYAHRRRHLFSGVWWCPAETRTVLLTHLATLGVELGAVSANERDIEKAAKRALRSLSESDASWLLIYDNVSDPSVVIDLIPSMASKLIVTSRFSDWGEFAHELPLQMLSASSAESFLEDRSGRKYDDGIGALAEALGCLPLALEHAAAYCRRTGMRFAAYAAQVRNLIDSLPRGSSYPRSVGATFDLALKEIVAQTPEAERLIAYLSLCGPEYIPVALLEGSFGASGDSDALLALAEVSLLRHDLFEDGDAAVSVHRLVQEVARRRAESNELLGPVAELLTSRMIEIYPSDGYSNPQSWPACARLTPHLLALRSAMEGRVATPDWVELLERSGNYLHARAAYAEAEQAYSRSLATAEGIFGSQHPRTAMALNNLAQLLQDQGNFQAAQPLLERALMIREKTLGSEHPDTANSLNNLALLHKNLKSFAVARTLYEKALAIRQNVLGPEHRSTAVSLNNLARLLLDQGDLADARILLERAVAIWEKTLGPEHPHTAAGLDNLAILLRRQNNVVAARAVQERALSSKEKVLGPDHPETAKSLGSLGNILHALGELSTARQSLERALAIREAALGVDHPHTIQNIKDLVALCQTEGDFAQARALSARAAGQTRRS